MVLSEDAQKSPASHAFLLLGVDFAVGPSYKVILVGNSKGSDMRSIISELGEHFTPNVTFSLKAPVEPNVGLSALRYELVEGKPTAYVCRNQTCLPPTNKKEKLLELLELS